jgi:hypothetical protein
MREAQVLQGPVDRIVRYRDAELLVEPHDQIAGTPAYDAVHCRYRAFFHDASQKGFVCLIELGRNPG